MMGLRLIGCVEYSMLLSFQSISGRRLFVRTGECFILILIDWPEQMARSKEDCSDASCFAESPSV